MEKLPAAAGVLAIIASLEPVESLTTEAVTPRFMPLMALERSFSVSPAVPVPVLMVAEVPAALVRVMDEEGRVAVGLVSRSEYHAPVVARLLTTTAWSPATVPVAAVAVTSLIGGGHGSRRQRAGQGIERGQVSCDRRSRCLNCGKGGCLAGERGLFCLPVPAPRRDPHR